MKKGNILQISGLILLFSFVSIIYLTLSIMHFGIFNDYLFYEMQNITETLEEQGTIKAGISNITITYADQFRQFNFHFDDIWFAIYLAFIMSSFIMAYYARPHNYFGFLSLLFYGVMFFLFLLTIFQTLTNWWNTNILTQLIPGTVVLLPKFYYYINHIGIFSAIQLVLCMVINLIDFDFGKLADKKEQQDMGDEEII